MAKKKSLFEIEAEIVARMDTTELQQEVESLSKTVGGSFQKAMKRAYDAGLHDELKAVDVLAKAYKDARKAQEKDIGNIALKRELVTLGKVRDQEISNIDKVAKRRLAAMKDIGLDVADQIFSQKSLEKAAGTFGEGLSGAIGDVLSGNVKAFAGLLKKFQAGAGKVAAIATMRADTDDKGEMTGRMGGVSKALGSISKVLGPLALAAGAFAAIVGAAFALDAKMKEIRRSLLDAGGTASDMTVQLGGVLKAFQQLQNVFLTGEGAFTFNRLWGTTAKDHYKIIGAYVNAGLTIKEMKTDIAGAADETEGLRKATETALTYSKLMGMTAEETAGHVATYMSDLSMSLDQVREGFSSIYDAAQQSGFGTKRFVGMVMQATAGMTMYNVRLEQAAGLLVTMGKLLGEKMGAELVGRLTSESKTMDTETRTKEALMGGPELTKILQKEANLQSNLFLTDLAKFKAVEQSDFKNRLGRINKELVSALDEGGEAFSKKLSELEPKQFEDAILGMDFTLQKRMRTLWMQSQAQKGTVGGVQAAMKAAGPQATLLRTLNKVALVLKKNISDISPDDIANMMGSEKIGQFSAEQVDQLHVIEGQGKSFHRALTQAQEQMQAAGDDEAKRVEIRSKFEKDYTEAIKTFGIGLTETGDRVRVTLDENWKGQEELLYQEAMKIGNEFTDLILGKGAEYGAALDMSALAEDVIAAQEIADAVTDSNIILEQGVEWMLGNISEILTDIYNAFLRFVGKMNEDEIAARNAVRDAKKAEAQKARAAAKESQGKIRDIEKRLAVARATKDADRVKSLEAELAAVKKTEALQKSAGAVASAAAGDLSGMTEGADVFDAFKDYTEADYEKLSTQYMVGPNGKALIESVSKDLSGAGVAVKQLVTGFSEIGDAQLAAGIDRKNLTEQEAALVEQLEASVRERKLLWLAATEEQQEKNRIDLNQALQAANVLATVSKFNPAEQQSTQIARLGGGKTGMWGSREVVAPETVTKDSTIAERTEVVVNTKAAAAVLKLIQGEPSAYLALDEQSKEAIAEMGTLGSEQVELLKEALAQAKKQFKISKKTLEAIPTAEEQASAAVVTADVEAVRTAPTTPPAKDFLYHLGKDGQVKLAQRIDSADDVTVAASKAGGVLRRMSDQAKMSQRIDKSDLPTAYMAGASSTGKPGAGGGPRITNHIYGNMASNLTAHERIRKVITGRS